MSDPPIQTLGMSRELIFFSVRKGTAFGLRQKNVKKGIERLLAPWQIVSVMPNQHAPDKDSIALYIPRELKEAVRKEAAERKMTITEYVEWVLISSTRNVTLTPDDYRRIAYETQQARENRKTDKRLRANRASRSA